MKKPTLTFDIETYANYTLFAFRNVKSLKLYTYEIKGADKSLTDADKKAINRLLDKNKIITFNGIKFDEPITSYALSGSTASEIFDAVQTIIVRKLPYYTFYKKMHCYPIIREHIDLIDVARGMASLKLYGARLGTRKLQDLPYAPDTLLSKKQMKVVKKYCENDLILTQELYEYLTPDLDIRKSMSEEYGVNLMSYKGAKIADIVLAQECEYTGRAVKAPDFITYEPPKYIKFKNKKLKLLLKQMKSHKFQISEAGKVEFPSFAKEKFIFDGLEYQFGIGGLHGSVSSTTIVPKKDETIIDIDYRSLYPSLQIQNNFHPTHLGDKYLETLLHMYYQRNMVLKPAMKKCEYGSEEYVKLDRQQDSMKLVLNSSFGQTGQKYAKIYDPKTMLSTTLTGQFTLMMVIEKLSLKGFETFYANTDGITLLVKTKAVDEIKKITAKFDKKTGLVMEYNLFKRSHIRDVNNFVNITDDDKVKSKGAFAEPDLEKNAQTPIVFEAVRKFLLDGTKIKKTIKACKNVNDFCSSRTVRGGAMFSDAVPELYPEGWFEKLNSTRGLTKKIIEEREKMEAHWVKDNGKYLGKVVRWYYSTKGKALFYKTSGNLVPKSEGAVPMMDLPDENKIPKDLDYQWYYEEAYQMLKDLGVKV